MAAAPDRPSHLAAAANRKSDSSPPSTDVRPLARPRASIKTDSFQTAFYLAPFWCGRRRRPIFKVPSQPGWQHSRSTLDAASSLPPSLCGGPARPSVAGLRTWPCRKHGWGLFRALPCLPRSLGPSALRQCRVQTATAAAGMADLGRERTTAHRPALGGGGGGHGVP